MEEAGNGGRKQEVKPTLTLVLASLVYSTLDLNLVRVVAVDIDVRLKNIP